MLLAAAVGTIDVNYFVQC